MVRLFVVLVLLYTALFIACHYVPAPRPAPHVAALEPRVR